MNKNEEKKMYLDRYRELRFELDNWFDEAEYWKDKSERANTINLNSFGIHGGKRPEPPADRFMDYAQKCQRKGNYTFRQQMEIKNSINQLDNSLYRTVLKLHFIDGYKIKHIADILNYSTGRTYHIFEEAINLFEIPKKSNF